MKFRTLNEGHRPCLIQTEFKNGFRDIKTPLCIYYSDISDAFEVLIERYNKWNEEHGYSIVRLLSLRKEKDLALKQQVIQTNTLR